MHSQVSSLLEGGVPLLIYHGEYDFIVNWIGGLAWTNALQWSGHAGFLLARNTSYVVAGESAGSFKSHGGLTYLKLKDAGHLVPMDVPEVALDMVGRFLAGRPLAS